MMTTTAPVRTGHVRAVVAARATLAAVFAVGVTLSADALGKSVVPDAVAVASLVFGAFQVVQGVIVALGVRAVPSRAGQLLQTLRAGTSVLLGLVALLLAHSGLGVLLLLVTVTFLITGVLELLVGVRRPDAAPTSRDAVAMGVLAMAVGILLSLLPPDVTVTVGVLAAWAAIAAVYLGIAAVSLGGAEAARS